MPESHPGGQIFVEELCDRVSCWSRNDIRGRPLHHGNMAGNVLYIYIFID